MSGKKKSSGSHGREDHHDRGHHGHHGASDNGVALKGTKADNVLTGTDRNDKLFGLKGDDQLYGSDDGGDVLIGGRRLPLVGTVSMDNITVDLGPEGGAAVGDRAVLIGPQDGERILCEEVANRLGTINYEVTCGLSRRVPRRHEE